MRLVSLAVLAAALGAVVQPAAASTTTSRPGLALNSGLRPSSPYAQYLVGRYAMNMGDLTTASQALSQAADADPADADLRARAFRATVLNGDIETASRLVQQGPALASLNATDRPVATLVAAAAAVQADRAASALATITGYTQAGGDERALITLRPYALAMAGKWTEAVDASGDAGLMKSDRGVVQVFLNKAVRARIYETHNQIAEADAVYKELYQPASASALFFGPDYAGFLERQGRKDEARTVWKSLADTYNDPVAQDALNRLDGPNFKPVQLPTLKASMSQALMMSAILYTNERNGEGAMTDLRVALYLNPANDRALLSLGQVEQEMKAPEMAEAAWAQIPATSPFAGEASLLRIWSLRGRGENDAALELIEQRLKESPNDLTLTVEKADVLHDQGKDRDALKIINDRIALKGEGDMTWQAWFITAIAYDSIDDWGKAEAAISKARALNAQRPEILNFLGYGWIDRGLHIKDGMDLIRQAMSLNPHSGAIVDSLGWGYYKLGDYDQALTYVEQAVQMEPSDAEVNEHLGDVYKALGRTAEARYEWQRVLTLQNATPKSLASVKAKLDATAQVASAEATAFNDKAPAKAK